MVKKWENDRDWNVNKNREFDNNFEVKRLLVRGKRKMLRVLVHGGGCDGERIVQEGEWQEIQRVTEILISSS